MSHPTVPHGDLRCDSLDRFFCVLCFRLACWCTGCWDQAQEVISQEYMADVPTADPGICDECWSMLGAGSEISASVVGAREPGTESR